MNISSIEKEIQALRQVLQLKEEQLLRLKEAKNKCKENVKDVPEIPKWAAERYSRQALLSELGQPKEILSKLIKSSVLIVGAGGLGCPVAIYLTGAGIGHIGIVDYDDVELTNIHRQPLHSELTLGMSKVESAAMTLKRLNSNVLITTYNKQLDSLNAMNIINEYDVVVDATDNAVTRYLINDACVLAGKPLVSAAALQLSGQFTVYNYSAKNTEGSIVKGPCYRCLFPKPPPPETMGSCSQNGVLGPVPGIMGCLQAVEVIHVLMGKSTIAGYLLMYDGSDCTFTRVKLRGRDIKCDVCSENPTITKLIDYEQFCNAQASDKDLKLNVLLSDERISPKDFKKNVQNKLSTINSQRICGPVAFIDVRSEGEFDLCNINNSVNVPITKIDYSDLAQTILNEKINEVYFVCRRGNDSQIACKSLMDIWNDKFASQENFKPMFKDIEGGLHEWAKTVDTNFPIY